MGRHRYVAGLAFGMSAPAHKASVGVLARGHAITAAISCVRPRRTRADPVRAFVSHGFQHYVWHDLWLYSAARQSERLHVWSKARFGARRCVEFYVCHLSSPQAMTNDKRKINRQASTHPDKGQCLPRSSLSPGKNTLRVATPPSEHYTIRILSPLT